jgi:transposase, IS5 family
MRKAITSLVDLAKKNNVDLRQTYERVVKRAAIKSGRYRHAKQINALSAGIGYNFRLLLR